MKIDIPSAHYAQGFRCGHIEGKPRCGCYVTGEEQLDSFYAADNQTNIRNEYERQEWAQGYRHGYRLAAQGDELPTAVAEYPLPS